MAVVTQTMQNQVTELYLGFFGRAPDAAGFGYWTEMLATGKANVEGIANAFSKTPEFVANYGGLTPTQQVTKIYLNVLNRAPDAGGLAYWTGLLNSGSSIGAVTYQIVDAAFSQVGTADGLLVQNKVTVGEYFAITLASNDTAIAATAYNLVTSAPASVVAAEAAITQGSGGTWALTTGIDTLTKGPFAEFVGTVSGTVAAQTGTLNAGDTLTGVGAGNILKVVDTTTGAGVTPLAGVALTNVQTLQVQTAGAVTSIYNLAATSGVTKVSSTNSTGAGGATFQGLAAGTTVEVAGSASAAGNITNYTYTSATSAPTISVSGGVNAQAIRNVGGTATSATINSTGGVNGVYTNGSTVTAAAVQSANNIQLTNGGAGGTITSLTVNAATNLRATLNVGDFSAVGAALSVNGAAGSVNLVAAGGAGRWASIDASGLTSGGVTVNASTTLTSFKGGAGNDNLTNPLGGAAIGATAVIDAGAGTDTLAATLVNVGNGAAFKNFEVLNLQGATAADQLILTNSTITGVSILGALGGAATVNNLVETTGGFNVTVAATAGANTQLVFTAASVAGAADVANFAFTNTALNALAVNAGTFTISGIERVNVASGGVTGSANALGLTDNSLQSVTVTGDRAFTLAVTAQDVIAGATVTSLNSVDASGITAATGSLTFVDSGLAVGAAAASSAGSILVKGSAGNDAITVVTSRAGTGTTLFGADTVDLSQGGIDQVTVGTVILAGAVVAAGDQSAFSNVGTAAADPTAFAVTTIVGAGAGDSIVFNPNTAAVGAAPVQVAGTMALNTAATNVSAATSLLGAVNLAAGGAAGALNWFNYGGNTYIVENVAGAANLQANDIVVQLVGNYNLTTASTAAGGVLTLA